MNQTERPLAVTIAAIVGFVLGVLGIFGAIAALLFAGGGTLVDAAGGAVAVTLGLTMSALGLVAMYGYWQMKKWGVYLLSATTAVQIVTTIVTGGFSFLGFLVPATLLGVGFVYLGQMS